MNPNSWQFDAQQLNALPLTLHTPKQRLAWGRRLYRFEVAGQGYWLKFQLASHHPVLMNGFQTELHFYQQMLAQPRPPTFLPEVQILERFELGSVQVNAALILKDVPALLTTDPLQFSRDHVIHIVFKMLQAVDELHHMGWLHADLKPAHFLLEGGRCQLIDFEQSQQIAKTALQQGLTATPRYMAPELFQGEPKTIQTDLYALGIILLEWLSQKRLQASCYQDWAYLHCQHLRVDLPVDFQCLKPLVQGLLAKQKKQRLISAVAAKHCLMTEIE